MTQTKRINLALQGGGAHGAFTWGVLDRLLEDDTLEIAAITGTSAGALNGAAFKAGWMSGGREGAKENLTWLWDQVMGLRSSALEAWMLPFSPALFSAGLEYSFPFAAASALGQSVSPYAWGPLYRNPLEDIVDQFDFSRVCAAQGPDLFVCATRVRNGKIRVFQHEEIGTASILASACLPTLFQAVEIDDTETGRKEAFWDGGYTGNPALFPLFADHLPPDVVIVNINPLERDEVPITPQQIQNRINEISFNSSLLRELRAIDFVQRLLEDGTLKSGDMSRVFVHMISDDDLMTELSVATKLVPNPAMILRLKQAGREAADDFLTLHKNGIGQGSTVDLRAMFG